MTSNTLLPWSTWQEMRSESKVNPESLLSVMLEAKVGHRRVLDARLCLRNSAFVSICRLDRMSLKRPPFAGVRAVCPVGGAPSRLSGAGPAAEDGTSASLAGAGADGRGLPGAERQ